MRHLRIPAVLAVFVVLLAACGRPADGGDMLTELGEGEGELNLIIWAGYAEDGSAVPGLRLGDAVRGGDRLHRQRADPG